jgi:hypothetical protein
LVTSAGAMPCGYCTLRSEVGVVLVLLSTVILRRVQ